MINLTHIAALPTTGGVGAILKLEVCRQAEVSLVMRFRLMLEEMKAQTGCRVKMPIAADYLVRMNEIDRSLGEEP